MSEQAANTPAVETAEKKELDAIVAGVAKNLGDGVATTLNDALKGFKEELQIDQKKKELEEKEAELKAKEEAIKKTQEELENEKVAKATLETKGAGVSVVNGSESAEINPILLSALQDAEEAERLLIKSMDLDVGTSINLFKDTAQPVNIIKNLFSNVTADGTIVTKDNINEINQFFRPVKIEDTKEMQKIVAKKENILEYKSASNTALMKANTNHYYDMAIPSIEIKNYNTNDKHLRKYVLEPKIEIKSDGLTQNVISTNNSVVALYRTQRKVVLPALPIDEYSDNSPIWQYIQEMPLDRVAGEDFERPLTVSLRELRQRKAPFNQPRSDKGEFSGYTFSAIDKLYGKANEVFQLAKIYNLCSFTPDIIRRMRSTGTIDPKFMNDMLQEMTIALDQRMRNNILSPGRVMPWIENPEWQKLSQAQVQGMFAPYLGAEDQPFDKSMPSWQKNRYFREVQAGVDFDESGYNVTATGSSGQKVYNPETPGQTGTLVNPKDIPCTFNDIDKLITGIKRTVPEISASVIGKEMPQVIVPETLFNSLPLNQKFKIIGNDGQRTVYGDNYGNYMDNALTVFITPTLGLRFIALPDRFFPDCFYTSQVSDTDASDSGQILAVNGRILRKNAVYAYFGDMSNLGYIVKSSYPTNVRNPEEMDIKWLENNGADVKEVKAFRIEREYQFIPGARQRIFQIKAPA